MLAQVADRLLYLFLQENAIAIVISRCDRCFSNQDAIACQILSPDC
jgi:hypothetical protein